MALSAAKTALPAGSVPPAPAKGASAICAATPEPTSSLRARTAVGESISRTYRSAFPRSTPPVSRPGFLIRRRSRMEVGVTRDRDDVGAPQVAVAPGRRRRIELGDRGGDVVADPEGRIREPTPRLRHVDDVRPLLERLRAPREVGGGLLQPRCRCPAATGRGGSPRRRSAGPLRPESHGPSGTRSSSCWRPRTAAGSRAAAAAFSLAADVDLGLVPGQVVAVLDVVEERRPDDGVLRRPGADAAAWMRRRPGEAAGRARRVAHLDRRAVEADVLRVHRGVERPPVVPALGDGRPGLDSAGAEPGRSRRGFPFGHQSLIGRVTASPIEFIAASLASMRRLVPLQPEVVLDARVVRLRRRLDQRRRHVAVQIEHVRAGAIPA